MAAKGPIYRNLDSLKPIKKVLDEAGEALKDKNRTIETSSMPEVLGGIAGGTIGIGVGLTLVYSAGVTGLSAVGISSGLGALGALVGGGMVAGIFVAGAPMAALGVAGYAVLAKRNKDKLLQVKEALFQEAIRKHDAMIRELNNRGNLAEKRMRYLESLIVLLKRALGDLGKDLGHDLNDWEEGIGRDSENARKPPSQESQGDQSAVSDDSGEELGLGPTAW